ncbi:hypothetical protein Q9L58_004189 [Maublancomyces gigas]|uniref:Cytochrome P450 n=1 Tax=Discina gigas TaxID=1032678 RepID=A0ABR3GLM8_9PEZI
MAKSLILAASAVASLLLARHVPEYSPPILWTFLGLYSVLLTSMFTYRTVLYPRFFSSIRHIPTPKGAHWLLGHFPEIFRNPTGTPHVKWVEELSNNEGLIRYIGLFGGERIMPCNAKTLSEVLHHKSYQFVKPPFMRESIGNILGLRGLLFAEGDEHRHQRKLLLPAFSHSHIKNLVPSFWSISRDLAESITSVVAAAENGVPVIEMGRWCSLATLDIIGRAGFGYEFHALETGSEDGESKNELAWAYNAVFKPTGWAKGMHIARIIVPGWFLASLPLRRNKEVRKASQTIKRISVEIINDKKLKLAEKKSTGGGDERDILSIMLNSGNYHGEDGVEAMRDQMMTFLTAGHETTATAMMWGLHLLSLKENRHIQLRLREEIRAAFPQGIPENVSFEQIEALKYLRNVTSEVLRVYPPVLLTARHAAEDTTLGGQFIPKGSHIVLVPWAINRSKELWGEDAEVFRPERWEEGQMESNYSFMTFLAGPRGCIGNVFAKVEYKCLLAALIGRFDFAEAVEGRVVVIKSGVTGKPQDGIPLKVSVVPGW